MFNDKKFAAYAFLLVAGTACVLTMAVTAGGASFPPVVYMIEHLALALAIRASYKTFDGPAWFPYRSQLRGGVAAEAAGAPDTASAIS